MSYARILPELVWVQALVDDTGLEFDFPSLLY